MGQRAKLSEIGEFFQMTLDFKNLTPEQRERLTATIRTRLAATVQMPDVRRADDLIDGYIEFALLVAKTTLDKGGVPTKKAERIVEEQRAELTVLRDAFIAWWKEKIGNEKSATQMEFAEFLRTYMGEG